MKKAKKLFLSKETLRNLDRKNLAGRVMGARPINDNTEAGCHTGTGTTIPTIEPCNDYTENCTNTCTEGC